jgi:hypothetical protein
MFDLDWQIARGDTDFLEIEVVDEEAELPVDITGTVISPLKNHPQNQIRKL